MIFTIEMILNIGIKYTQNQPVFARIAHNDPIIRSRKGAYKIRMKLL